MCKERFSTHGKSKLQSIGDMSFHILERINDNTYKVDLLGEYGVSATFNIFNFCLFDVGYNSRLNRFKKRENDEN
jgi:hypothetical protein